MFILNKYINILFKILDCRNILFNFKYYYIYLYIFYIKFNFLTCRSNIY